MEPKQADEAIGLLQQTITWDMVVGKLIIIPALGHQNKGKSSFTGSGLFVLMSQCGNNNQLAHHHVACDRLLQKAYCSGQADSSAGNLVRVHQSWRGFNPAWRRM